MLVKRLVVGLGIATLAASLSMGCAAQPDDSGIGQEENAETSEGELRSATVSILGMIADGETKTATYSNPPTYRAFRFIANGGDEITANVVSSDGDGDPVAWITSSRFAVYAANDDASEETFDSQVTYKIPESAPRRTYFIVFRDYAGYKSSFEVSLNIKAPPPPCDPDNEPNMNYIGTPQTCPTIRYTCKAGTKAFTNDCGCGCTR